MVPFDSQPPSCSNDNATGGGRDNAATGKAAAANPAKAELIEEGLTGLRLEAQETPKPDAAQLLLAACRAGNLNKAKKIFETVAAGVFETARDTKGETPLHLAALAGALDLVQWLIAQKLPGDKENNAGLTPLAYAAHGNQAGMVKTLAEAGAEINHRRPKILETPLMTAAYWGANETILALLKAGADVNAKDANGVTAAMRAAGQNHAEALSLLANAGAALDTASLTGRTVWDFALRSEASATLRFLKTRMDPHAMLFQAAEAGLPPRAPVLSPEEDTTAQNCLQAASS